MINENREMVIDRSKNTFVRKLKSKQLWKILLDRNRKMGREKRAGNRNKDESAFSRAVSAVFAFVRLAEFEILFFLFLMITFIIFKDLVRHPRFFIYFYIYCKEKEKKKKQI